MRATLAVLSALLVSVASAAVAQQRTTLDIYVTDVEGVLGTCTVHRLRLPRG